MAAPVRITNPLLDVLEFFLRAWRDDEYLHGWAIMKAVKRSGPTVYGVLNRIEDAGWIVGSWDQDSEPGRPRRRLYRLTPNGHVEAVRLVAERRPVISRTRVGQPNRGMSWFRPLASDGSPR